MRLHKYSVKLHKIILFIKLNKFDIHKESTEWKKVDNTLLKYDSGELYLKYILET